MPTFFLCLVLVCWSTLGWAQAPGDTWPSLGSLAETAAHPDRSLAAPAVLLASELAHSIDAFDVDEKEIPPGALQIFQSLWLEIAAEDKRWVDIRIYALDVAMQLHRVLGTHSGTEPKENWLPFLEDADPQMRAAALTLLPPAPKLTPIVLALLADGRSEQVSLAAAQRLCGPLGSTSTRRLALPPEVVVRLQSLAGNRHLPITARVDLAPCLFAENSLPSRRALGVLLQESPPALRRALRDLTQSTSPQPSKR